MPAATQSVRCKVLRMFMLSQYWLRRAPFPQEYSVNTISEIGFWLGQLKGLESMSSKSFVMPVVEGKVHVLRKQSQVVSCAIMRKLANELGFLQTKPTVLWEDNNGCLSVVQTGHYRGRSKHSLWGFSSSLITWQRYSELALCDYQGPIGGPWN